MLQNKLSTFLFLFFYFEVIFSQLTHKHVHERCYSFSMPVILMQPRFFTFSIFSSFFLFFLNFNFNSSKVLITVHLHYLFTNSGEHDFIPSHVTFNTVKCNCSCSEMTIKVLLLFENSIELEEKGEIVKISIQFN